MLEKEDIKKLMFSLNKACGAETLSDERLEKAFTVWYPTLEEQLNALFRTRPLSPTPEEDGAIDSSSEILEEILDLTRNNQKLLRNPDGEFVKEVEQIKAMLEKLTRRMDMDSDPRRHRRDKKMHPMFIEELLHVSPRFEANLTGFQIAISLFRTDFPWLYDAGLDIARTLRSTVPPEEKQAAVNAFYELVEFTFEHPIMREMYMPDKEMWIMARELPRILRRSLEKYI